MQAHLNYSNTFFNFGVKFEIYNHMFKFFKFLLILGWHELYKYLFIFYISFFPFILIQSITYTSMVKFFIFPSFLF